VGLALAIRASPNAVGEEATPPEFSFFEAPVYAPGLLSTCVRSCLETGDRRYLRRSVALWAEIFSAGALEFGMSSESPACGRTGGDSADAGIE
jgi:hypothetical protein